MNPISDNPFAVLSLIAGPAILTNATALLTLMTSNRYGLVVDRWRALRQEVRQLDPSTHYYERRAKNAERFDRRATHILAAIRLLYTALALLSGSTLLALLGAVFAIYRVEGFGVFAGLGILAGASAVGCIAFACTFLFREANLALQQVREESELLREHIEATGKA
jgi:hypothetical protein